MNKRMKRTVFVVALFALVAFTGYNASAHGDSLTEKIGKLKQEFLAKEKQMENETDIRKQIVLGDEMKQKGLEIGELTPPSEPTFEEQLKNAEVDLWMQQKYLSVDDTHKHLVEKLKPAHQIIKEVKENKDGKTIDQLAQDIDKVYEIMKATMTEVNQFNPTTAP